jgi:hypothetical protein
MLAEDRGGLAAALTQTLAEAPFPAYFWECAPVDRATAAAAPFQCVVVEAGRSLSARAANPAAFDEHFARAGRG